MEMTEFFEEKRRKENRMLRFHCVGCGLFEAMAAESIIVNSYNQGRGIEEVLKEWSKNSFIDPRCDDFVKDYYRKAAEVVTRWSDAHPESQEAKAGETIVDLEKMALEGDRKAQRKLTRKGIALPCPRCKRSTFVFVTSDGWGAEVKCQKCHTFLGWAENAKDALQIWNRRPAKPRGHCKDCINNDEPKCYGDKLHDDGYCELFSRRPHG